MQRRRFLQLVATTSLAGCVGQAVPDDPDTSAPGLDAGTAPPDARPTPAVDARPDSPDAGPCEDAPTVLMYDTYAQALYLDGTLGPLTGIIYVDYLLAGEPIELEFWHGHGGQQHRFTLLPEHYAQLLAGQRVTLTTTAVEDHQHELFIDPTDPTYRVPGAPGVEVPVGC